MCIGGHGLATIVILADVSNEMWVAILLLLFRLPSEKIRSLLPQSVVMDSFLCPSKEQRDNNNNNKRELYIYIYIKGRMFGPEWIARRHSPRERNVNDTDQRVWRGDACTRATIRVKREKKKNWSRAIIVVNDDSCAIFLFPVTKLSVPRSWTKTTEPHLMKTKQTHTRIAHTKS